MECHEGPHRNSEPERSLRKEVTVTEHTPYIDFENLPAPSPGFLVTLFITVRSVARSRAFYSEVLGRWKSSPLKKGAPLRQSSGAKVVLSSIAPVSSPCASAP